MAKLAKILISIIILISVFIIGFFVYLKLDQAGFFLSKEEKYFYRKLKEFKESEKEVILLKDLTNFEWDKVGYVGPYSGVEFYIDEKHYKLNKKVDNQSDSLACLLFINNKSKTGIVIYVSPYEFDNYKTQTDFEIYNSKLITSDAAVLKILNKGKTKILLLTN